MAQTLKLPQVIAHRGASADAPENTLAALELAINQGALWLEIDVNVSSDGELFVYHDDTLKRCTDGEGYLVAKTAKDLTQLDAGSWFSAAFAGQRIPTLAQVLALLAKNNTGLNLEIKATAGADLSLTQAVCKFIEAHWPEEIPLLVSSFSPLVLEEFRRHLPHHPLGLLVCAVPGDWLDWMQRFQCTTLHCAADFVTESICESASEAGIPVLCYTVNDAAQAQTLLNMGVTSVFSDHPKKIMTALQ